MVFEEIIGGIAILASLYFIGIIISRSIILSARRQEVEMAEKEVHIKRERLRLLEGEVHELELIGDGNEEFKEEAKRIQKEKLEVIIAEKVEPKNRW
jgi:flagellar motility protein MotE (MotC chaperone)